MISPRPIPSCVRQAGFLPATPEPNSLSTCLVRCIGSNGRSGLWLLRIALAPFVRSAAVRLPIATPLWRQLRRYELAATTAIILGIFGLILALFLQLPALALLGLAAFAVPIAVHFWRRNHWVNVGQVQDGWVKLSGCHPDFVAELETSEVSLLS